MCPSGRSGCASSGDSFVAGVGDPAHLGWVGRLAARAETRGLVLTGYNLGIRLNTSSHVRARWQQEVQLRFPEGLDNRLVLSLGVNDTTPVRVKPGPNLRCPVRTSTPSSPEPSTPAGRRW